MDDKLPIVLAHGLCGFDEIKIFGITIQYFKGIKKHLEECGHTVFVTKVRPTASIKERAEEFKKQILGFTKGKVHIIGHSMAGLDARYMISKLEMADRVATLVTIGTPHWGSYFADWGVKVLGKGCKCIWFIEKILRIDTQGFIDVTTEKCNEFNKNILDIAGVKYISYAGVQKWYKINLLLQMPYWYIRYRAGANDGLVHLESAKWGEFKGIVAADHWNQIGWWIFPFGGQKKFDVKGFYEKIAGTDLV